MKRNALPHVSATPNTSSQSSGLKAVLSATAGALGDFSDVSTDALLLLSVEMLCCVEEDDPEADKRLAPADSRFDPASMPIAI